MKHKKIKTGIPLKVTVDCEMTILGHLGFLLVKIGIYIISKTAIKGKITCEI